MSESDVLTAALRQHHQQSPARTPTHVQKDTEDEKQQPSSPRSHHQHYSPPPPPVVRYTLTSHSNTHDRSISDPQNPSARKIIDMAISLGIDPQKEFYLLPLAMYALETPEEWKAAAQSIEVEEIQPPAQSQKAQSASHTPRATTAASSHHPSIIPLTSLQPIQPPPREWFRKLVDQERMKWRKSLGSSSVSDNSPWMRIHSGLGEEEEVEEDEEQAAAFNEEEQKQSDQPTAAASSSSSSASFTNTAAAAPSSSSSPHRHRPAPHYYYYNFKTLRSSAIPPMKPAPSPSSAAQSGLIPPSNLNKHNDLTQMKFTSWFLNTRGVKQYILITYLMIQEEYEIRLIYTDPLAATQEQRDSAEAENKIFRVKSLKLKNGASQNTNISQYANCWDLHLKATLEVFGRPTTLLQCDSDTRIWIETNAARLLQVRTQLERQLSKYETVATSKRQVNVPLVECHLRALMKDVARLKNALAAHRPSLAEQYAL